MIGSGPEEAKARSLAQDQNLQNLGFHGWMDPEELTEHIAEADLVLGAFGTSKQLELTNNQKIYEGFAMMKPVISGASPAIPEVLQHGVHLYLCERGNPVSLADGIRKLKTDLVLRETLITNGKEIVHQYFDTNKIGQTAAAHLNKLVQKHISKGS